MTGGILDQVQWNSSNELSLSSFINDTGCHGQEL